MIALPSESLTHVELIWIEKQIEHWIRFGHEVAEQILDRRRRILSFAPNSVFAYVRWAGNDYGTVVSRIDILRAVGPGEALLDRRLCPPWRRDPAADFRAGRRSSRFCRQSMPSRPIGIDPAEACPDHWRHVHNRLDGRRDPRPYRRGRHAGWLKRRALER